LNILSNFLGGSFVMHWLSSVNWLLVDWLCGHLNISDFRLRFSVSVLVACWNLDISCLGVVDSRIVGLWLHIARLFNHITRFSGDVT